MLTPDFADMRRRALRAVNEDGLFDFGLGLGLLLVAVWFVLQRFTGFRSSGLFAILPILVMFLVRGMRARFTYPRVGFARPSVGPLRLGVVIALVGFLVLGVVALLVFELTSLRVSRSIFHYLPAFLGLLGAGGLALFGNRAGLVRMYVYAALVLVALAAVYALRAEEIYFFIVPAGLAGVVMFVTGIVLFVRFLRRHPKPAPGATDEA